MNSQEKAEIEAASNDDNLRHVTLDHPIRRGETEIASVTVSRPFGPALRGLSLAKIVNDADHDTLATLIPRVTQPMISKLDIDSGTLWPSDLLQIAGEITGFFIPNSEKAGLSQTG